VVGNLHRLQVGAAALGRTLRRGRRAHRCGRAQVVNRCIDDVAIDVELALHDVAKIDGGGKPGRQLDALYRHVASKSGAIGDVPEVGVRSDVTDPHRTIGRRSHRERQRVALTHGDVNEAQVPDLAEVRQLAGRIERSTHDRDRMREQLHTTLADRRRTCGLRLRRP
jgi:hypothetical protein